MYQNCLLQAALKCASANSCWPLMHDVDRNKDIIPLLGKQITKSVAFSCC